MPTLCFEWKNMQLIYQEELLVIEAQIDCGPDKNAIKRSVQIGLRFGNCCVERATLSQLIYIRSVLQFFTQSYWKRRNKSGSIEERYRIKKELQAGDIWIVFTTRHKGFSPGNCESGLVTLNIEATDGLNEYTDYFDCQEVMMLEMAFSKAIGLVATDIDSSKWKVQKFR